MSPGAQSIFSDRRGWIAAAVLALAWGVLPGLPTWLEGELLGHGYTDLYPSVWGLWGFTQAQPALPGQTPLLGFPEGMGFYYSSPIKGWLAWPLMGVLGLVHTWNLLTIGARVATVLAAFGAAQAWGFRGAGALAAAALYGCSPFFHGYAVEGIAEGTDGWPLALLVMALGQRKPVWSACALGLSVWASWYLGMAGCLLVVLAGLRDRRAPLALLGLVLAAPALWTFVQAFPGTEPLDPTVRLAMGARPAIPTPGLAEGLSPFAMNAYIGWAAGLAAVFSRSRWLALAAVPLLLSTGWGPWYELPVAELVRFPYRWHAASLILLAPAVAITANRLRGWWLGPLIALEALLLGPTEPLIPGAPAQAPPGLAAIDGPVLDIPGVLARPPGQANPSRSRARQVLFFQTQHQQPSPWLLDFNSVGVTGSDHHLAPWRALDPLESDTPPALPPTAVQDLADQGIEFLAVHTREFGPARSQALHPLLVDAGAQAIVQDSRLWVYRLPAPTR